MDEAALFGRHKIQIRPAEYAPSRQFHQTLDATIRDIAVPNARSPESPQIHAMQVLPQLESPECGAAHARRNLQRPRRLWYLQRYYSGTGNAVFQQLQRSSRPGPGGLQRATQLNGTE